MTKGEVGFTTAEWFILCTRDFDAVRQVPICSHGSEDTLISHYTPTGKVTVSSAYRVAFQHKHRMHQAESSAGRKRD